MKIDYANLQLQYQEYKNVIDKRIHSVLDKSNYILGSEVKDLENALTSFTKAKYVIACSSGTDALTLSLMALNIKEGDEIITSPFSFISTAETIALLKAKPVFVDIEEDTYNIDVSLIESAITPKTKAIIPVSLYGQPSDMDAITMIAKKYNLKVIIDGAQSFGSTYKGLKDSNLGDISTTSFFPAKPLGCYGDGGAIFTNNHEYAEKIRMMHVHGQRKRYHHQYLGLGARLDTIQASILLAKLPYYEKEILRRQTVAERYSAKLTSIKSPVIRENRTSVWAQYTIKVSNREDMQSKLKEKGIPTAVHYPIPLHLQNCFAFLNYKYGDLPVVEKAANEVLSLPMNAFLKNEEVDYVAENLNNIIK